MNHTYRLLWSHARRAWVVVGETARSQSKNTTRAVVLAAASLAVTAMLASPTQAGPSGGQVTTGQGAISDSADTTTINQSSNNLSVNWQSFNVSANETVNFIQPSATAIAVNRILDTNGSKIMGNINANGQVYLINPNGILFGQNAQVNVGALVASTLDIADASLSNTQQTFAGNGMGSIVNQGQIAAQQGGFVALIGNSVSNQGTINTPQGTTALGAGNKVTVTFADSHIIDMQVDQSVLDSQALNGGLIQANGGVVLMSAGAKDAVLASLVNNTGIIRANTVAEIDGKIILLGGMTAGRTQVAGTLDASAPDGGDGGFIETSAAKVTIEETTIISTKAADGNSGTWLIDPVDFTIASSDFTIASSDFTIASSGGDMTGATLTSNLANGNVIIQSTSGGSGTAGDLNVNDTVSWSANKLTLNAQNDIKVSANMTATGTASLALEYGQSAVVAGNTSKFTTSGASISLPASTTNFTTKQGSDGTVKNYTIITSLGAENSTTATDLQGMQGGLRTNYALGGNVDAAATSGWYNGFDPVGTYGGMFEGLGHTISNLTINAASSTEQGLFGRIYGAYIGNVTFENASVTGLREVGVVSGEAISSTLLNINLLNISVTGGYQLTGGLVGGGTSMTVSDVHVKGTSTISGGGWIGGLSGCFGASSIVNSSSNATVLGTGERVGGLFGDIWNGTTVSTSKVSGSVTGSDNTGGIVGSVDGANTIEYSYSTATVKGYRRVGGLVGRFTNSSAKIVNSYSSGSVTAKGSSYNGGLVGAGGGIVTNSYWDRQTSGFETSGGGTPLYTAEMQTEGSYSGWDFDKTWNAPSSGKYPTLQHYNDNAPLTPLVITVASKSKTYNNAVYAGDYSVSYEGFIGADSSASLGVVGFSYAGAAKAATNVGTYAITASGYTSNKYSFSYTPGTLTIAKAGLSITGLSVANKTYDGSKVAVLSGTPKIKTLGVDLVSVTGTGVGKFNSTDVGEAVAVSVTGYRLTGKDAGNYNLLQPTGLNADIETASEPKSKAIARVLASLKLPTFSVKPLVRMVAPVIRPVARPIAAPVVLAKAGGAKPVRQGNAVAKPEAKVESGGAATASTSTDAGASPSTGTTTATVAVKSESKAQPVVTASVSLGSGGSVSFVMDGGVNMPETMVASNDEQ